MKSSQSKVNKHFFSNWRESSFQPIVLILSVLRHSNVRRLVLKGTVVISEIKRKAENIKKQVFVESTLAYATVVLIAAIFISIFEF